MRNIFDQYQQLENRITHALLCALDADRKLLRSFFKEVLTLDVPCAIKRLALTGQSFPAFQQSGHVEIELKEQERRGIPDGWIHDGDEWCVIIESKVQSTPKNDQIVRHIRTARKYFKRVTPVIIAARKPNERLDGYIQLQWSQIYLWLSRFQGKSEWADRAKSFLEISEAKLVSSNREVKERLTGFAGFPFGGKPFSYIEAKMVLKSVMQELRKRTDLKKELQMDPESKGREAITGRETNRVWDFLKIEAAKHSKSHTDFPHLTLGINDEYLEVMITVPNSVNQAMQKSLKELGSAGFSDLTQSILKNMRPLLKLQGAAPWFRGVQRRFKNPRTVDAIDAQIDFDLRTAFKAVGKPKFQPRWLSAAYGSLTNKDGANYQVQVGMLFSHKKCAELRDSKKSLDLIAFTWIACKPLLKLAR